MLAISQVSETARALTSACAAARLCDFYDQTLKEPVPQEFNQLLLQLGTEKGASSGTVDPKPVGGST